MLVFEEVVYVLDNENYIYHDGVSGKDFLQNTRTAFELWHNQKAWPCLSVYNIPEGKAGR